MTVHPGHKKGFATMLTKTKIVLINAVLLGSASQAFALDPDGFDVDIFRPSAMQHAAAPTAHTQRGFVQAPARLGGGSVRAPITAGEQGIMDRASRSFW